MDVQSQLPHLFIFYNSKSGDGKNSRKFNKLQIENMIFNLKVKSEFRMVQLYLYELNNETKRKKGFETVKKQIQNNQKIIIVSAGGDGTIIWILDELQQIQIDFTQISFAILPYGTGNDLSQFLKWGTNFQLDLIANEFEELKKLMLQWLSATEIQFDVWEVEVLTFKKGQFKKIQQKQKKSIIDKNGQKVRMIKCFMANYLGIGLDAKVVMEFEQQRTQITCFNNFQYCFNGFKNIFRKNTDINNILSDFIENEEFNCQSTKSQLKVEGYNQNLFISERSNSDQIMIENIIYSQKKDKQKKEESQISINQFLQKNNIKINKNQQQLVCLNIPNYMGGRTQPYKNSKQFSANILFQEQSVNDRQLEFCTFGDQLSMGLETVFKGQANNIYQGSGPFQLLFKNQDGNKLIVHFQIDGESYEVEQPKKMLIKQSQRFINGQIKVLQRKN